MRTAPAGAWPCLKGKPDEFSPTLNEDSNWVGTGCIPIPLQMLSLARTQTEDQYRTGIAAQRSVTPLLFPPAPLTLLAGGCATSSPEPQLHWWSVQPS